MYSTSMKRAASGSAPSPAKRPKPARALLSPPAPAPAPASSSASAQDVGSAEDAVLELTGQRARPQLAVAVATPSLEQLCVDALAADIDLAPRSVAGALPSLPIARAPHPRRPHARLPAGIPRFSSVGFLPRAVAERLVAAVFARHRLSPALLR